MPFKKKIIHTKLAPSAVGTYSQGVEHNNTFYFSGQIGLNPKNMEMTDGLEGQILQIFENVDGLLKSQDLTRENIIKTSVFLVNLDDFGTINKEYESYFTAPYPPRSCIEVTKLPKDALVEIEVIAAR